MSSIPIRFKQSVGIVFAPPTSLLPGEPAVYLNSGNGGIRMWVGSDQGVPVLVGASDIFLRLTGGTMTGQINGIAPVADANLTRKDYVDAADALRITSVAADARFLQLTGGTVTGQINGIAPVAAANLTRRDYVDAADALRITSVDADARFLQLTGGTVTGQINGITPVAAANLTRRDYVDAQVATRLTQAQGDARFAQIVHTHVETDITNLNRTRWRGAWAVGAYLANDMVTSGGITYVALTNTSTAPPSAAWAIMGAAGAAIKVSDTPPVGPSPGDLWYRSAGSVGLFMWYVDATSSQWISTDQSSAYFSNMLQLIGGTMTGKLLIQPNPAIAVGLELVGAFSGAAIRLPANQSIAFDTAGTITMRYDSASNSIQFLRSGVVKNTISMA